MEKAVPGVTTAKYNYANLGCGSRYIESWINFDFVSNTPEVQQADLSKGIPLPNDSVAVTYHSHVLEHFSKEQGAEFIRECMRILKPEGIIRIAVPDLEGITRFYIESLTKAKEKDNQVHEADHSWATLELIDQMVREKSGGEMANFWRQPNIINENTLIARVGGEYIGFKNRKSIQNIPTRHKLSLGQRLRTKLLGRIKGKEKAIPLKDPRQTGEVHKWMYDSYSLRKLLEKSGFKEVQRASAEKSMIPNWEEFKSLDMENGNVRKPDSLFMEAKKI